MALGKTSSESRSKSVTDCWAQLDLYLTVGLALVLCQ